MRALLKFSTSLDLKSVLIVAETKPQAVKKLNELDVKCFSHHQEKIKSNGLSVLQSDQGLVGVLIFDKETQKQEVPGAFLPTKYSYFRDHVRGWLKETSFNDFSLAVAKGMSEESLIGFGVGLEMATYFFKDQDQSLKVHLSKEEAKKIQKGIDTGVSVNEARLLVDTPPNDLGPKAFKDKIVKDFSKAKGFSVEVLDRKRLLKEGYGLISGVGQGAESGPFLVHVSYKSRGAKKNIGAVGKGITFDTGGLDLKPSQFMRWMKKDMGGAGSLFGLAHAVKNLKPKLNIDFVFCIAENAVSDRAFRPGDVLRAKNGLSVEVHNTDAEGRLAMASGLNYLSSLKKKFDLCFDVSTLTGAIKVGLGDRVGGLFSNDLKLGSQLQKISKTVGDPLWLMPIPHWTKASLDKSHVADLLNCTEGYGGALSAAEFLRLFVPKDVPWFHLDLYAWTDSERGAYSSKGATGQGVQSLISWISQL